MHTLHSPSSLLFLILPVSDGCLEPPGSHQAPPGYSLNTLSFVQQSVNPKRLRVLWEHRPQAVHFTAVFLPLHTETDIESELNTYLLWARCWARHITYKILSNPLNNFIEEIIITIYQWRNWGLERLSNSLMITGLVSPRELIFEYGSLAIWLYLLHWFKDMKDVFTGLEELTPE